MKHWPSILFQCLSWAILGLSLLACTPPPSHPLKLGSNPWPGYEPVYLARELGYLDPARVKLVELPSSSDVMQHLRDGNLHGAMLTLDEVITLRSEGLRLRVILVLDVSQGADTVLVRPELQSLADLRGRRIGAETTSVGAVMLESLLEKAGLTEDQVKIIHLTADRHETGYRSGQVDAIVTFEPTRSRLLALGARELFTSREVPDRIVDVLTIREEALDEFASSIRHVVTAYFRARDHMEHHREGDLARIAPRLGLSVDELTRAYDGLHLPDRKENHHWLVPRGKLDKNAVQLAREMRNWHLIHRIPDLTHLADNRYLLP